VVEFLTILDLDKYAPLFSNQQVDSMATLCSLTEQDLKETGIASVGHRRQIMLSIQAYRTEQQKKKVIAARQVAQAYMPNGLSDMRPLVSGGSQVHDGKQGDNGMSLPAIVPAGLLGGGFGFPMSNPGSTDYTYSHGQSRHVMNGSSASAHVSRSSGGIGSMVAGPPGVTATAPSHATSTSILSKSYIPKSIDNGVAARTGHSQSSLEPIDRHDLVAKLKEKSGRTCG
jgi:hypothetical protein